MGGYIAADRNIIDVHPQLRAGLHLHDLAVAGARRRRAGQRPPPQGIRRPSARRSRTRAAMLKAIFARREAAGDASRPRISCRCWSATR